MYFVRHPELTLVGSSPEPMVQLLDGRVISRPIAGTRRRGRTEEDDRRLAAELAEHPKELAEHVMLVDLARNDVGPGRRVRHRAGRRDDDPRALQPRDAPHLAGVGRAAPTGTTPIDVLRATLPAGTVSGAPKVRAMEIIDELEPVEARARTPASSATSTSRATSTPPSPSARWSWPDGRASVQAGAGIVADSVPERRGPRVPQQGPGAARRGGRGPPPGAARSTRRRRTSMTLTDDLAALHAGRRVVDRSDRGCVSSPARTPSRSSRRCVGRSRRAGRRRRGACLLLHPAGQARRRLPPRPRRRRRVARLRSRLGCAAGRVAATASRSGCKAEVVDRTGEFGHARATSAATRRDPRRGRRADAATWSDRLGPRPLGPRAIDAAPAHARRRRRWRTTRGASKRASRVQPVDIDETTIPQEAFLEPTRCRSPRGATSARSSCAASTAAGHVNRFLRRFTAVEGDWPDRRRGRRRRARSSARSRASRRRRAAHRRARATCGARSNRRRRRVELRWAGGTRRACRHADAGSGPRRTSPRSGCRRCRSARRARRRPSPRRARARSPGRGPVPTRAARARCASVEPLEHVGEVLRRDAGAVVVDVQLDRVAAAGRDADRDDASSRTSARSRPGWRRSARADRGRRPRARRRRRRTRCVEAELGAAGPNASTASCDDRRRRPGADRARTGAPRAGRGRAGRRPGVRAGATRDEITSAARMRASLALDGAVGDRFGVAADRGERRAQVVRHGEQERALEPTRDVERVGHGVDRVRQARRARRRGRRWCRPAPTKSPPAMRPGGGLHGRERAGHAAGQVRGDQGGDPERDGGGAEHRQAAAAERAGVHVLGEHEHRRGVADRRERLGDEHRVAVAPVLRVAREQRLWCRGRRRSRPSGSVGVAPRCRAAGRAPPARRRSRRRRRLRRSRPAASC